VRVVKTGKRRGEHYFKLSLHPCDREGSSKP
jgi:hypothetical protein